MKKLSVEKRYFSTAELAIILNVSPSLIRTWEKIFQIHPKQKKSGGTKRFSKLQLEKFRHIRHLVKEKGYTLLGAQKAVTRSFSTPLEGEWLPALKKVRGLLLQCKAYFEEELQEEDDDSRSTDA